MMSFGKDQNITSTDLAVKTNLTQISHLKVDQKSMNMSKVSCTQFIGFKGTKSKRNIPANIEKKDKKLEFGSKYHRKSSRDLIKQYGAKIRPKSSYSRQSNRNNKSYAISQMK